jgi:hypothetical protein
MSYMDLFVVNLSTSDYHNFLEMDKGNETNSTHFDVSKISKWVQASQTPNSRLENGRWSVELMFEWTLYFSPNLV